MRAEPWTAAQKARIKSCFDTGTNVKRIGAFISQVGIQLFGTWLINRALTAESHATMDVKLARVERAASELLAALSRLREGDAYTYLMGDRVGYVLTKVATAMQITMPQASSGNFTDSVLSRLWDDAAFLGLRTSVARAGIKSSRKHKGVDRRKNELAGFLYLEWELVFGEPPSTQRDGEFHRVAAAVAEALDENLIIGARTIAASKRSSAIWNYLRP